MTKLDKLVDKIRARPVEARFSDVQRLLHAYGWTIGREKGSHVSFVKSGQAPLTIPKVGGTMVKQVYLDTICQRLGLDD